MKISILGSGKMGSTLASLLASAGHTIMVGSRDPEDAARKFTAANSVKTASQKEAVKFADVIIVATPWMVTLETLRELGDMEGKVLIDITNPLSPDISSLLVGADSSAAEEIARIQPKAEVVKAFNGVNAANLSNPKFSGETVQIFYCGDSLQAKSVCKEIITTLGFEAVDCGALTNARWLEPMAMLWIQMAFVEGLGMDFSFKMVKAEAG